MTCVSCVTSVMCHSTVISLAIHLMNISCVIENDINDIRHK